MVAYSWADVVDGGPTLGQHWVIVLCSWVQRIRLITAAYFTLDPIVDYQIVK